MNDADELDGDLQELATLWQADTAPEVDTARLRRQFHRERLFLLAEMLVVAGGLLIGLLGILEGLPAMGFAAVLFSLGAGAATLHARRGVDRSLLNAVAPQLRARYAAQLRQLRIAWAGMAVIAMALVFIAALLVIDDAPGQFSSRPWSIAAALLCIATALPLAARNLLRAALARERLARLLAETGRTADADPATRADGAASADSAESAEQ